MPKPLGLDDDAIPGSVLLAKGDRVASAQGLSAECPTHRDQDEGYPSAPFGAVSMHSISAVRRSRAILPPEPPD